jgi:hypothetical protein
MIPSTESIKPLTLKDDVIYIGDVIGFKTTRQHNEFFDPQLNEYVQLLVLSMCSFVKLYSDATIVITDVFRTRLEAIELYKNEPSKQPVVSKHEVWKAVDIRVWNLPSNVIEAILLYYVQSNLTKIGGLLIKHTVQGNANHIHIQVA